MGDRVLVWGLSNHRAGTEAVIYNYVTHAPDTKFDFLCYEAPENYQDLFEGTDNSYYVIPIKIKHPLANWRAMRTFMKEHAGDYSTVWVNLNDTSNIDILIEAERYGIPRRITHVHNAGLPDVFITKLFSKLNWNRCLRLATDYWACSKAAGDFFYGDLAYRVIPNAVDSKARAYDEKKRELVRAEWNLDGKYVIGTVGRLVEQKNQGLLINVLPGILARRPNAALLIVGEGDLRKELEVRASELGIEDRVIFAGSQQDMQAYYSAFDVFAFPSIYEGLSLSLLEAQFNGLPCVVSDGVSSETFISRNIQVIPTNDESRWTRALLGASRGQAPLIEDLARKYTLESIKGLAPSLF